MMPHTQPESESTKHPERFRLQSSYHPSWLFLSLTIPQILLWLTFFYQYTLIQSLLSEKQKGYWMEYGSLVGIGILASLGLIAFCRIKRRPLPTWIGPLLLLAYIGLLFFYLREMPSLLPFNIPQWMIQRDELTFLPFSFTMPVLFHALLMLIAYFTPDEENTKGWPNFFYALLVPLGWYLFVQIAIPFLRTRTYLNERILLIFFICTTVCFFFFLLRGLFLVLRDNTNTSVYAPLLRLVIVLVLPLAGLLTYNARMLLRGGMHTPQIVGDLSHPLFFVCALVAAGALLAPPSALPRVRLALFSLRIVVYPYTLYFFLIFLPFLPLSIFAILVMGLGFLMLAPTLLMVLHSAMLLKEWKALRLHYHGSLLGIVAILSFFVLPTGIIAYMTQERATLHRALAYLYQPTHLRVQAPNIHPVLLQNSIHALRQHHQRRRGRNMFFQNDQNVPFFSSLYKHIVLDNMTLSQNKIDELSHVFLGTPATQRTIATARPFQPPQTPQPVQAQPIPATPQKAASSQPSMQPAQATPTTNPSSPQPSMRPAIRATLSTSQPTTTAQSATFTPATNAPSIATTTQPTRTALPSAFRTTTPQITALQTTTNYDPTIQSYKSTVLLRIKNNGRWQQEFSTTFHVPLGVWATDYALWIDGKKVDGVLTEKKATLWIYQQIVRARQDPGLLYYEDATTLRLRVFPVPARGTRQTSFTLLHKAPFSLKFGSKTYRLDDTRVTQRAAQSIERLWNDQLLFVPHPQKAKLPLLTRTPYLHVVIDASKSRQSHYALYSEQIRQIHQRYSLDPTRTRVTFANYQAHTTAWSPDLLQRLERYPAQGGLFLVRILKRIYLEHATQNSRSFPVVLVLTPRIHEAILKQRLQGLAFLSPDTPYFYSLNTQGQMTRHTLYGPSIDKIIPNTRSLVSQPFSLRSVRAWPDAQHPRAFLSDDAQDSLVLRLASVNKMPNAVLPDDPWQAGLAIYGRWLLQQLRLGGQDNWLEQIRWSWRARTLSPTTSFTVLENEAQWVALRRKQKQVLAGKSFFDLTDEGPRRADEPPLGWLLLLLALFLLYQKRKQIFVREN